MGRRQQAPAHRLRSEVFDASGAFLGRWGSCGFGDGQFDGAGGIAVDAAGKVYIADYSNNRVQVFQVRDLPRAVGQKW